MTLNLTDRQKRLLWWAVQYMQANIGDAEIEAWAYEHINEGQNWSPDEELGRLKVELERCGYDRAGIERSKP